MRNYTSATCRFILGCLLTALLFTPLAFAQVSSSTGSIQGVVKDDSGAVLTDTTVVLTNPAISLTRQTKTSADGTFTFPLLQPSSTYSVSVTKDGFKAYKVDKLTVSITENTVANVGLSAGDVSEQVTVSADAETIQTTSATLGRVVGSLVIESLPLPTRNVLDLMSTDAGVVATLDSPASTIAQGAGAIYVAGSRATSNNFMFNGVDANNFEFQTLADGIVPIPDPDSVQEFRTQTSLYDATTGYSSGGNINLITRAGTNTYHGTVYEFFRNTVLNANDWFFNHSHTAIPVMQQNQFGASLGGKVPFVPATFFFVNYEGLRQKNGVSGAVSGAFPVFPTVRNATTLAAAFSTTGPTGVTISPSQIDPVAVNLLNAPGPYGGLLFPQASGALGKTGTYTFSKPVILNSNEVNSRMDHDFTIFGQSNHLSGAGFWESQLYLNPSGDSSSALGQPYSYPLQSTSAALTDTHVFRSNLINELVYGFNVNRRGITAIGGVGIGDVGMTRPNTITSLLPNISITNLMSAGGYTVNVQHPQNAASFDLRDTLSYIKGKHSFRYGFETRREEFNDGVYVPRGSLTFAGKIFDSNAMTPSSPIQDFLTGSPSNVSLISGLPQLDFRAHDYVGFIQDDYRALSKLTLNLGIRYDHLGNPFEIKNQISNFDPSLLDANTRLNGGAGLAAAFVVAGQNGVTRTTMLNHNNGNISPRIGIAYDVLGNGKLAVRGGFGMYYQATGYALQFANSGNPPYQLSYNSNVTQTDTLANPFPTDAEGAPPSPNSYPQLPNWPKLTGFTAAGAPTFTAVDQNGNTVYEAGVVPLTPQPTSAISVSAIDRHIKSPYSENFNLTVEYEFIKDWTIELGYIGTRGIRQTSNTQQNNALLINAAHPGRTVGGTTIATNTSGNRDSRVPIMGIGNSSYSYVTNNANSTFDAFVATLNHHFAHGFLIKAAYTHSKSIDNYSANAGTSYSGSSLGNPFDLGLNRGISEQDIPNRLVVTYVWQIPGFKHGLLSYALGNWSFSGITTIQSGAAGVVTQSIGSGSFDGTSGYGALVAHCPLTESGSIQSHPVAGSNALYYLNPSCATTQPLQAAGSTLTGLTQYQTPGNESFPVGTGGGYLLGNQTRGVFFAPRQNRSDMTLSKNFPVHAFGPAGTVEFRAEAFKIFNNPIFSAPASAATISPTAAPGTPTGTFGQITSTIDQTGRQFQFAIKASF